MYPLKVGSSKSRVRCYTIKVSTLSSSDDDYHRHHDHPPFLIWVTMPAMDTTHPSCLISRTDSTCHLKLTYNNNTNNKPFPAELLCAVSFPMWQLSENMLRILPGRETDVFGCAIQLARCHCLSPCLRFIRVSFVTEWCHGGCLQYVFTLLLFQLARYVAALWVSEHWADRQRRSETVVS